MNDLDFCFELGDASGEPTLEISWPDPEGALCECCGDPIHHVVILPQDKMLDLYLLLRNHYESC